MNTAKLRKEIDKLHGIKVKIGRLADGKAKYAMNELSRNIDEAVALLLVIELPTTIAEVKHSVLDEIRGAQAIVQDEYSRVDVRLSNGQETVSDQVKRQVDVIRGALSKLDTKALFWLEQNSSIR